MDTGDLFLEVGMGFLLVSTVFLWLTIRAASKQISNVRNEIPLMIDSLVWDTIEVEGSDGKKTTAKVPSQRIRGMIAAAIPALMPVVIEQGREFIKTIKIKSPEGNELPLNLESLDPSTIVKALKIPKRYEGLVQVAAPIILPRILGWLNGIGGGAPAAAAKAATELAANPFLK